MNRVGRMWATPHRVTRAGRRTGNCPPLPILSPPMAPRVRRAFITGALSLVHLRAALLPSPVESAHLDLARAAAITGSEAGGW